MKNFIFKNITFKFTYGELYAGLELNYLTTIQIIDLIEQKRTFDDPHRSHLDYYFKLEESLFEFNKLLIKDNERKDEFKIKLDTKVFDGDKRDFFIYNNRALIKIWEFIVLKKLVNEFSNNLDLLINLVNNEFSTFNHPDEWNERVMIKFSYKDPGALNETVFKNILAFINENELYFKNRNCSE